MSCHRLPILDFVQALQYLLRVIFKVLDSLVKFSLASSKLLEFPVANTKQGPIEKDDFSEPINPDVESFLIRYAVILLFTLLLPTIFTASILEESLNFVSAVAHIGEELETKWVRFRILEVTDDQVVDWAQRGSHDYDAESHQGHGHVDPTLLFKSFI